MYLKGTRIIEWASGLPAAFAARVLCDLGAEVLKIEPPEGDPLRRWEPFVGIPSANSSALFGYLNAGKRSVVLDPRADGPTLDGLISGCNVLIETQTPESLSSWWLDMDSLRTRNPSMVVTSVSPFGQGSRYFHNPSTDLTLQHQSGLAYHQARPVKDPRVMPPLSGADHDAPLAAGLGAAIATLWGLMVADKTGKGPHIDFAILDFYSQLLFEGLAEYREGEREFDRERREIKGTEVAGGLIWILPCSDGWVMTSPREQHQWDRWMAVLGNPAWANDKALCGDKQTRKAKWTQIQTAMSQWTKMRTRHEVFEAARAASVPCFPVSRPGDILANEQLAHREFFNTLVEDSGLSVVMPGLPFLARTTGEHELPRASKLHVPALGEANPEFVNASVQTGPSNNVREKARLDRVS